MTSSRSEIRIWAPIIAKAVGEEIFSARDVPEIPGMTLRKLADFGYLTVVRRPHNEGRTYIPAHYRLNRSSKYVKDALKREGAI